MEQELQITIEQLLSVGQLIDQEVLVSPVFELLKNFSGNFSKSVTLTFQFEADRLTKNQIASLVVMRRYNLRNER
ncbi:hypothetical protein Back11_62940 [Paenibacillus baekrokdamisoli]|uniref:Uncharacterized protein n=1 Tax=Paenibacillus baekrokdamisoli TaxID=1712516 RepID=A0A3G9JPG6_9BACL|nr:hypothetical protein Back11_62940 [Paenibacillus baekrokdamisoli]